MIENPPTLEFCLGAAPLTWKDVVWAVEKGIFGWRDVQKFALVNLGNERSSTFDIDNQIVGLGKNDASEIMRLGQSAASSECESEDIPDRWRFLLLKWVYEKRDSFTHPLGVVEELYAEFGYPEDMESFVSFLPPSDGWEPMKHSASENEARLFEKWRVYVETRRETGALGSGLAASDG